VKWRRWDSSVSSVQVTNRKVGVRFLARTMKGRLSFRHRVQIGSGPTQPPIQWVVGGLSLRVKGPRREADHSPPPSAEVKNAWSYTPMAWCLITRAMTTVHWRRCKRSRNGWGQEVPKIAWNYKSTWIWVRDGTRRRCKENLQAGTGIPCLICEKNKKKCSIS